MLYCWLVDYIRCKLKASAQNVEFEIEIVGNECQLNQPYFPELSHICGKLMKPAQLIQV